MLPSRGEKLADGINVASRPARVRMRFRTDVTPDMRFVIDGRVMQIIAGPAELGHREGLEFMVEEYCPAGQIGRAHVRTPITQSQLVCRLLLGKKKTPKQLSDPAPCICPALTPELTQDSGDTTGSQSQLT